MIVRNQDQSRWVIVDGQIDVFQLRPLADGCGQESGCGRREPPRAPLHCVLLLYQAASGGSPRSGDESAPENGDGLATRTAEIGD